MPVLRGCRALALAAFLLVGGCGTTEPCNEVTRTVEVEYGSPLEDLQRNLLRLYRNDGFDCSNSESIRNAFGNVIGAKYTCVKCE